MRPPLILFAQLALSNARLSKQTRAKDAPGSSMSRLSPASPAEITLSPVLSTPVSMYACTVDAAHPTGGLLECPILADVPADIVPPTLIPTGLATGQRAPYLPRTARARASQFPKQVLPPPIESFSSSQLTPPVTAYTESTLAASSSTSFSGFQHTSVLVGVLVPLLIIALVIAILIYRCQRRGRRRRPRVFDGDWKDPIPDPPSKVPIPETLPDGVCEKDSQGWTNSDSISRSNDIILASSSNGATLSRTPTFASSNWPDTPLPRAATAGILDIANELVKRQLYM
ncbi:hypothetical protein MVEN_02573600 [Mycena venus]|uniref:Uncharacterized protein n=1 Tax=Mycena venus TaxID=2733690 RepID=A0A8H6U328_9AGAR|nr:hypothetical protein MVEN_02573600 [Mycena venus]